MTIAVALSWTAIPTAKAARDFRAAFGLARTKVE
jgi:hypothetical protein